MQLAQNLFHLFHDQLHAVAQLLRRTAGLERQLEVVHHGQKLLYHVAGCIVAKIVPLALGPLAGVLKLRLQSRQAVKQLVALRLQLLKLRRARGRFAARCCSVRVLPTPRPP